jgi:hypothetical protein
MGAPAFFDEGMNEINRCVCQVPDRLLPKRGWKIACGLEKKWEVRTVSQGGSYDPETIALLRNVLDAAWHSFSPEHQACTSKSHLAERVLKLAARGERDPARLRVRAIVEVIPQRPRT